MTALWAAAFLATLGLIVVPVIMDRRGEREIHE